MNNCPDIGMLGKERGRTWGGNTCTKKVQTMHTDMSQGTQGKVTMHVDEKGQSKKGEQERQLGWSNSALNSDVNNRTGTMLLKRGARLEKCPHRAETTSSVKAPASIGQSASRKKKRGEKKGPARNT